MATNSTARLTNIAQLVNGFVTAVEQALMTRARELVLRAVGERASTPDGARRLGTRGSLPRQLCPVPGCENTAAPIFGMVCKEHKDVPRREIKKDREERRADRAMKKRRGAGLKQKTPPAAAKKRTPNRKRAKSAGTKRRTSKLSRERRSPPPATATAAPAPQTETAATA